MLVSLSFHLERVACLFLSIPSASRFYRHTFRSQSNFKSFKIFQRFKLEFDTLCLCNTTSGMALPTHPSTTLVFVWKRIRFAPFTLSVHSTPVFSEQLCNAGAAIWCGGSGTDTFGNHHPRSCYSGLVLDIVWSLCWEPVEGKAVWLLFFDDCLVRMMFSWFCPSHSLANPLVTLFLSFSLCTGVLLSSGCVWFTRLLWEIKAV